MIIRIGNFSAFSITLHEIRLRVWKKISISFSINKDITKKDLLKGLEE